MNVRLVIERKRRRIWSADLKGGEATVGRALGSTVRIPSSQVSRMHCRLRIEDGVVTVEDLESANGTYLNGERVRDVEMVHPGDRLTVGRVTFVVEYEMTPDVVERLRGGEDYDLVDGSSEVELIEQPPARKSAPPPTEPLTTAGEPLAEVEPVADEADDRDVFAFGEAEPLNLPEGGDLRDFLVELDDTDEPRRNRR